jgi:hypothetical protein
MWFIQIGTVVQPKHWDYPVELPYKDGICVFWSIVIVKFCFHGCIQKVVANHLGEFNIFFNLMHDVLLFTHLLSSHVTMLFN